jgi:hypothetical protein
MVYGETFFLVFVVVVLKKIEVMRSACSREEKRRKHTHTHTHIARQVT